MMGILRRKRPGEFDKLLGLLIVVLAVAVFWVPSAFAQQDEPATGQSAAGQPAVEEEEEAPEAIEYVTDLVIKPDQGPYRRDLSRGIGITSEGYSTSWRPLSLRRYEAEIGVGGWVARSATAYTDLKMPTGPGFDAGPVTLFPRLFLEGTYHSNIYLQKEEEADWQTHGSLELETLVPLVPNRRHNFLVGGFVDQTWSSNFSNQTTTNAGGSAAVLLDFPSQSQLRFSTVMQYLETPGQLEEDEEAPYYNTRTEAALRQGITTKVALEGVVYYETQDFEKSSDQIDDYWLAGAQADAYIQILPKTSIVVEGQVAQTDQRDDARDNWLYRGLGGFAWDPTAKLRGRVLGGWEVRDYEEGGGGADTDDFTASVDLSYIITPKVQATLIGFRGSQVTSDYYENIDDGRSYISTGGALSLGWAVTPELQLSARGTIVQDEYTEESLLTTEGKVDDRKDTLYGVGVSITYRFPNALMLGGDYDYTRRESTKEGEEWDSDHNFSFRISWEKQWTRGNRVRPYGRFGVQERNYTDNDDEYVGYFATIGVEADF